MSGDKQNEEKKGLGFYMNLGPVWGYFFRKKDPNRPSSFNLKVMHGINKISIIMFLVGLIFFIIKLMNR